MNAKEAAGNQAAEYVENGMVVGLGTGSTAEYAIRALGNRVRAGLEITAVSTSVASTKLAEHLEIEVVSLEDEPVVDITIDGADEVDPQLDLIKGLGGALLREKIVASATTRQIIIIDQSKLVEKLGTQAPLPVEVVPFAWPLIQRAFIERDLRPVLRKIADGEVFETDNGNFIIDCGFPTGIEDAVQSESWINALPGVVENGLFVHLTDLVVVGADDGSCRLIEKN
ncbi:MAG: ribose-5-phosphate isomerase RpiA [Candidatus Latescibacterota bacterium]|jgi:ribose 5-phosphate isomerase A